MIDQQQRLNTERLWLRAGLAAFVAASMAANVVSAEPTWLGRTVAAAPPVVLFACMEMLIWISNDKTLPALNVLRWATTIAVAFAAGWMSYFHIETAVLLAGESADAARLYPIVIDGGMIVTSVSLVMVSRQIRSVCHSQPEPKIDREPIHLVESTETPQPEDNQRSPEALRVLELVEEGMSKSGIASELGISRSQVYRYIKGEAA